MSGSLVDVELPANFECRRFWQGPVYPNATTNKTAEEVTFDCSDGCLFQLYEDPSEHHDLAKENPSKLAEMRARLLALNATSFQAPALAKDVARCRAFVDAHSGFVGPYYSGTY